MRKEKGITLVALVVTIIVLLILAGVTIAMVLGQNGIFGKAETAKENTTIAQEKEAIRLGALEATVENKTNNVAFETGFKVEGATVTAKTDGYEVIFSGSGNKYTTDANGQNIQGPTQGEDTPPVASRYDNPYVPEGFIHTEGEWNTGFVIQDKANGNEFVWIPVGGSINGKTIELKRTMFMGEEDSASGYNETLDSNFAESVKNNGGYYIGRYEASYGGGTSAADYVAQSKKVETSKATEEDFVKDSAHVGYLWNYITQPEAIVACENMYKGSSITSKLMSSYAWDTALTFINAAEGKNIDDDSSAWGNYIDNPILGNIQLAGTGAYEKTRACNIYDIAGNVSEWTTERYTTSSVVFRGGNYGDPASVIPAGGRIFFEIETPYSGNDVGFRAILYR